METEQEMDELEATVDVEYESPQCLPVFRYEVAVKGDKLVPRVEKMVQQVIAKLAAWD